MAAIPRAPGQLAVPVQPQDGPRDEREPVDGRARAEGILRRQSLRESAARTYVDPAAEPDDCGARPAAPRLATAVRREALTRGLIIELGGRHGGVVRLLPPLTITDDQAEAVLERLADSIAAAERSAPGGTL